MKKWWKRVMSGSKASSPSAPQPDVADQTFRGDYDGTGVWYECGNCDTVHEIEETSDYRALIETLCTSVSESSARLLDQHGLRTGEGRWDIMPDDALFVFTDAEGRKYTAPYGVVGSWNETSHSWLWTWAMPEGWLTPQSRAVCERLRARARQEDGWTPVLFGNLLVNEHEAWHLTNLAAWVSDMPIVYRAKVNEMNWHYFAIGTLERAH